MAEKKFDEHPLTETEKLKLQNVNLQRALLESKAQLWKNEMDKAKAQGREVLDGIRKRLGISEDLPIEPSDDLSKIRTPHIDPIPSTPPEPQTPPIQPSAPIIPSEEPSVEVNSTDPEAPNA